MFCFGLAASIHKYNASLAIGNCDPERAIDFCDPEYLQGVCCSHPLHLKQGAQNHAQQITGGKYQ